MKSPIVYEEIQELRRRQGIVDAVLKVDIEQLQPGNKVKLSLQLDPNGFETVVVCITSIRESTLRGKLVKKPKGPGLRALDVGSFLRFQSSHIHSIVGRNNSSACMDRSMPMPSGRELLRAARVEAELECETPSPRIRNNVD
jgi:hypothetical protein